VFTAATTPILGLMAPADSDQFEASDYATTFTILDRVPGVALVDAYTDLAKLSAGTGLANYTGSPWTTTQNGRLAFDRHNNALWRYTNPSGTATWVRANTVDLTNHNIGGYATQSINVSTKTATGTTGALVVSTGSFTVPGGRNLSIDLDIQGDNTSGSNGLGVFTLTDSSNILHTWTLRLGAPIGNDGSSHNLKFIFTNPAAESSHDFRLYVRCATSAVSNGGGGTTTVRYSALTVTEI
jgi:hypothetical protein